MVVYESLRVVVTQSPSFDFPARGRMLCTWHFWNMFAWLSIDNHQQIQALNLIHRMAQKCPSHSRTFVILSHWWFQSGKKAYILTSATKTVKKVQEWARKSKSCPPGRMYCKAEKLTRARSLGRAVVKRMRMLLGSYAHPRPME